MNEIIVAPEEDNHEKNCSQTSRDPVPLNNPCGTVLGELVDLAWTRADKDKRSPNLLRMVRHTTNFTRYLEKVRVKVTLEILEKEQTPISESSVVGGSVHLCVQTLLARQRFFTKLCAVFHGVKHCYGSRSSRIRKFFDWTDQDPRPDPIFLT